VAGDVSARASVSGNKRIEKSYKERFSRNPCKTDALFAPQLSKQHESVRQMRRTIDVFVLFIFASPNKGAPRHRIVDLIYKTKLEDIKMKTSYKKFFE